MHIAVLLIDTAIVTAGCKLVDLRTGEETQVSTGEAREEISTSRRNRGFLGDLTAAVVGETVGDIVGVVNQVRKIDYGVLGTRACVSMMGSLTKGIPYGPYHPLYTE